jgi:hypothetical protein
MRHKTATQEMQNTEEMYLYRRNGVWQFRRRVPADLAGVIKPNHFHYSLGTKDKSEARLRLSAALAESEHIIRKERERLHNVPANVRLTWRKKGGNGNWVGKHGGNGHYQGVADQQDSSNAGSNQATKMHDLKGIHLDHVFYCTIAFKAAVDLRTALNIDEVAFRKMAPSAWHDPRPAFIYRVLDEVQKAGLCINEWYEKLKDQSTPDPADHETRLTHQWLLDEQNFRARKLAEVLVDLICFSATNEPEYYRDYLQLLDLNTTVRSLVDQEEFFGFRRRNGQWTADWTVKDIIAGEAKLDVSKRWYLEDPGPFQERWRKSLIRFSSFRQRYIRSLELALPSELAVLGKTYIHAYGKMSSDIHFTPQETSWNFDPDTVYLGFNRVGLLCFAILIRCQDLLGIVADGSNAELRKIHDKTTPSETVADLKQEKAEVGRLCVGGGIHLRGRGNRAKRTGLPSLLAALC